MLMSGNDRELYSANLNTVRRTRDESDKRAIWVYWDGKYAGLMAALYIMGYMVRVDRLDDGSYNHVIIEY